ncbi:hypothetical protein B0A55_01249 [Friedmanniomyces simplex]|uniref:Uncharacterized protein n=1 Tax=Friedmanniomyces simplex TaxID=329884 RepID=A0A4U0Y4N0_9PEZI|nr:hypothetical protein B0A55_01249 [Friedmanniomyces simplex]
MAMISDSLKREEELEQAPFRLLDLPPELQLRIYDFAVCSDEPVEITEFRAESKESKVADDGDEGQANINGSVPSIGAHLPQHPRGCPEALLLPEPLQSELRASYCNESDTFVDKGGSDLFIEWLRCIGASNRDLIVKLNLFDRMFMEDAMEDALDVHGLKDRCLQQTVGQLENSGCSPSLAWITDPPRCHLFELPVELQLHIYELVIVRSKAIKIHHPRCYGFEGGDRGGDPKLPAKSGFIKRHDRRKRQPPLSRTCRSIRDLALPVYYGCNIFETCCCRIWDVDEGFGPVRGWLLKIGPANRKLLKELYVHDDAGGGEVNAEQDVAKIARLHGLGARGTVMTSRRA